MTEAAPAPGRLIPSTGRRSPPIYRVTKPGTTVSHATKRVLGMWVPAEAFRRGTVIRLSGQSATASTIFRLSIGGPSNIINPGVALTFSTGPAAAANFDLRAVQRADGINPTFDSAGYFVGGTSLPQTTATSVPFIQPLNYVEVNTNGTFTLVGVMLEVIPQQYTNQPYQEVLDV